MNDIKIKGEARLVIKNSQGIIRRDTGYVSNSITNTGLNNFNSTVSNFANYCVIGTSNEAFSREQTKLFDTITGSPLIKSKVDFDFIGKVKDKYMFNREYHYTFDNLDNVSIREVGLTSNYVDNNTYRLNSRCLVKDLLDVNTTTVKVYSGESLDIYYRIWFEYSLLPQSYLFTLSNGKGINTDYEVSCTLAGVNLRTYVNDTSISGNVADLSLYKVYLSSKEPSSYLVLPAASEIDAEKEITLDDYDIGSFERFLNIKLKGNSYSGDIRTIIIGTPLGYWQFRFSNVLDESPIPKTVNDELKLKLKLKWGG